MPEQDPQLGQRYRARVFVDFWNYTLSMRGVDAAFRTDWSRLGPVLAAAAVACINPQAPCEYQGLNFYGSYDPASEGDRGLYRWATTKVDTFPGVSVSIVPRQRKRSPPKCPACHHEVAVCPSCGTDMRGTEEKGVDVRMATDMIRLAWVDNYDVAVLVSSDKDFVPVAEFLETRGDQGHSRSVPAAGSRSDPEVLGLDRCRWFSREFSIREIEIEGFLFTSPVAIWGASKSVGPNGETVLRLKVP